MDLDRPLPDERDAEIESLHERLAGLEGLWTRLADLDGLRARVAEWEGVRGLVADALRRLSGLEAALADEGMRQQELAARGGVAEHRLAEVEQGLERLRRAAENQAPAPCRLSMPLEVLDASGRVI